MSNNGHKGAPPRRTEAVTRKSWWPGWIWAVPIAAVGIVVWLAVRALSTGGIDVTVTFDEAAGMKASDTKVLYRGVKVGQVTNVALAADGSHVVARLNIDDAMEKDLTSGTQFYLEGARPSLSDPASLKAILAGPTIVMQPGAGKPARQFSGIAGTPPQALAVAVPYLVRFDGPVGGLRTGSPVTFRGFTVGDVASVRLTTDAETGKVSTPVVLMLDPTRFHIQNAPAKTEDWSEVMNATMTKLVRQGLRARLDQTPPLIGDQQVALATVPDAGEAELDMSGRYPEIPAVSAGGLGSLVTTLGHLPVSQIADNVRGITRRVKALVASPKLQDSIDRLDEALTELDKTVQKAGPEVAPTIKSLHETVTSLRKTAREIDATAKAAAEITGTAPPAANGNLERALRELTEAARSIRTLADYLDQHPEALIKGR